MWTYYGFKIAGFTIAFIPRKIGYFFSRLIGELIYLLSPGTRAAVFDNMRHVFGAKANKSSVRKAARGVLRNTIMNYYDLIKLPRKDHGDIEERVTKYGWHHLEDAYNSGKGLIIVTAHIGSFDTAAQSLAARSINTTILVEPLEPTKLLDHICSLRNSQGLSFIPANMGALRHLVRTLRNGEAILLTCDRDFAKDGIKMDFFGEEASMPAGAVRIAMKTGSIVVPAFNLRRAHGRYEVYVEPPIDIIYEGDGAVEENVARVTRALERCISRGPDQWVVLSRIWPDGSNQ